MLDYRTARSAACLAMAREVTLASRDEPITVQSTLPVASGGWPLLFALNFAHGLPPESIVPPAQRAWPTIIPCDRAVVSAAAVAAVLNRPAEALGRGRVLLGEMDTRLGGLVASLDVLRVVGKGNALVNALVVVSRVEPEGGSSAADTDVLWSLARTAVRQQATRCGSLNDLGDDAFLAIYGQTAQVVWRSAEVLATVSACYLDAEAEWLVQSALAVASLVDMIGTSRDSDHGPIGSGLPFECEPQGSSVA